MVVVFWLMMMIIMTMMMMMMKYGACLNWWYIIPFCSLIIYIFNDNSIYLSYWVYVYIDTIVTKTHCLFYCLSGCLSIPWLYLSPFGLILYQIGVPPLRQWFIGDIVYPCPQTLIGHQSEVAGYFIWGYYVSVLYLIVGNSYPKNGYNMGNSMRKMWLQFVPFGCFLLLFLAVRGVWQNKHQKSSLSGPYYSLLYNYL